MSSTEIHTGNSDVSQTTSLAGASTTSVVEGSPGRNPSSQTHPTSHRQDHNLGQTGTGTRNNTGGRVEPAEEEGGAARGTASHPDDKPPEPQGGYPEQMHAGKLDGYGPEYGRMHKATMKDKMDGAKEYVAGLVKRDERLKEDARKTISGEKKRENLDQANDSDPFSNAPDDKGNEQPNPGQKSDAGVTDVDHAHPTDKGRQEQATHVRPEGHEAPGLTNEAKANAEAAGNV